MLIVLAGLVATMALGFTASGFGAFYYLSPSLPSVEEMREIPLQIPLRVYSRDGRLLEEIGEKRRYPIDYDEIPHVVRDAFLAAEDDRFFDHPGFDYQGIVRAALNMLKTGTRAQGGSTITQQLAREYFLTRDRTFVRKAKELILATQIENEFSKEEILELYLNKIFLGQRAYGVVLVCPRHHPDLTPSRARNRQPSGALTCCDECMSSSLSMQNNWTQRLPHL
jgi:penicillin-binding protein 1A